MHTLAITGGKGGTGKTLMAVNFAVQLAQDGYSVLFIDTDVENPNSNILLGVPLSREPVDQATIEIFLPSFDPSLCTQCGTCRSACYRHAILQFPGQFPSVMSHMCSGCRMCERVCPTHAITACTRPIGNQYFLPAIQPRLDLLVGELFPNEAVSALIVERILEAAREKMQAKSYDFLVIDTAPGAHCDVEKSLEAADHIIAVTEPTPFGLHDLQRIFALLDLTHRTTSVILNRSDLTSFRQPLLDYLTAYRHSLIGEIPVDPIIIEDYARGIPFIMDDRTFAGKSAFQAMYHQVLQKITGGGASQW